MQISNTWARDRRPSRCNCKWAIFALLTVVATTAAHGTEPDEKKYAFFSPQAQATLDRLSAIRQGLPDGPWRYHPGDVAHGEDPSLDDSGWKLGKGTYQIADGSVWFRRTLIVPRSFLGYELRDVRLFFQFHAFAHGAMPEILYVNGRRIAMGENLEPVELIDRVVPGVPIHIAVKLLHTADVKSIEPATYLLRFSDSHPNPVDIAAEIQAAAAVLPVLVPDKAELHEAQQKLNAAALAIDVHALDVGDSVALDTSLRKTEQMLEPLRPLLSQASVYLVGNSHIDTAWVWPWTETVDVVRRTFSTALQLMPEYPNYKFTQSVALYGSWMQEKYPDLFEEMKARTVEKRWEPVGGMWVEPDLNMPDGESLVRQLLIGKSFFRKEMGVDIKVGWNPDSFGYSWQLPQIYKRSGIDYFVTQKMHWNENDHLLPLKLFWWQSPDGSRVLTYFPPSYDQNTKPVPTAEDLADAAVILPGDTALLRLYGVGDHGGGPTRVMLDEAEHWQRPDAIFPKLKFATAESFFRDMESHLDHQAQPPTWNYRSLAQGAAKPPPADGSAFRIPVWNDELYLETARGTYTSQAGQKRNMRTSEVSMLNAEKVASIAWLGGRSYPSEELTDAWKKVLFNQFHDIAAGSSIPAVYKDAERDYEAAQLASSEVTRRSLEEIAAHTDTRVGNGSVPLLVFNPLAWKRTDIVEVEVQLPTAASEGVEVTTSEGKPLLAQVLRRDAETGRARLLLRAEDVPSLGYRVFAVRSGEQATATDLRTDGTTIENASLRVVVDPATGCIAHLIDKRSEYDSIAANGCGNELQTFVDTPKQYDAWNIDADALKTMTPIRSADSVKLIESGPVRAIVRVQRHWGSSTFVQDITLYAGIDRIDVVNDIDWHETHKLLKAAFPLAASSDHATYEIPYGTIERPTTRNNVVEKAKFEVPALRWADLGDGRHGFSLLNDSKYGYDAAENVLRLSLLRSPTYPDPHADQGQHHFVYSLYPHVGSWQQALTIRQGYGLNYPMSALQQPSHGGSLGSAHSFLSIKGDGVVLTAMKKSDQSNDLILRLFEWEGKASAVEVSVPGRPVAGAEAGMMEDTSLGVLPMVAGHVLLNVKPYAIHTVKISYGKDSSVWDDMP